MISLNKPTDDILHFKKRIEDKIEHAFLGKHIHKPVIDEDKLFILLHSIPMNSSFTYAQRDTRIITTMLVQVALDTHDLVTAENEGDQTREHLLNKQLQVLAGDYYSGLYYYLLSHVDDLKFVHKLAVVIKEINEVKMKLYYNEFKTFQEYMELKVHLETLLITNVAMLNEDEPFNEILKEWFYIRQLMIERNERSHPNEEKIEQLINNRIADFILKLENIVYQKPAWKEYFSGRLNNLHGFNTSIAKEG